MANRGDSAKPDKVWATLVTNLDYLPGVLTLNYRLQRVNSEHPLVVLYTDVFPESGRQELRSRHIATQMIPHLAPSESQDYENDPRFNDCWTKLAAFSLTEYSRIVLLDSDMLVMRNMDELMDLELDHPSISATADATESKRVFAASHACTCNPLKRPHYPDDWIPRNCAFSSQHDDPEMAQHTGASPAEGLGKLNSGLLVLNPSKFIFEQILEDMEIHGVEYQFPDQDLLAELYRGRWVALPYVYNALKTMRSSGVHDAIWRDSQVKNVHYIMSPKPWNELGLDGSWHGRDETHKWWISANAERLAAEKQ